MLWRLAQPFPLGGTPCRPAPVAVERAAQNGQRCSGRVSIQAEHLLIERHQLRRWLVGGAGDGVRAAQRQLLQDVFLKGRCRNGRGGHDRQSDAHPFAVEKEEQLVAQDRPSQAAAEMVHRGARLVIARSGVGEEVGGIESRSVPQLVQVSVELIRSGFGDVVDLRRSIAALIDRVGERVHRDLGDRIETQHQIRREAAVQIRERIVGFEAVHDVAVGERRQTVELDVAVAVRAADEIVAAAGRIDQGARRELQWIRHVAAGIRQILERRRVQRGRGVRILRIHQRRLAGHRHLSLCGGELQDEVDRLLLSQARRETDSLVCGSKPSASALTEYDPGFNCGKLKRPASSVFALRFDPGLGADDGYGGACDGGSAGIGDRAHDGAGGLSLGQEALREDRRETPGTARRKSMSMRSNMN